MQSFSDAGALPYVFKFCVVLFLTKMVNMNLLNQKLRLFSAIKLALMAFFAVIFFGLVITPANAATDGWHIKDDATGGECSVIGDWNAGNKTCTLSQDLSQGIIIDSNNIVLDGNGRMITGSNTGAGVYLDGRAGVTIKNLNVQKFAVGIYLRLSSGNTLTNNTTNSNIAGITITDFSDSNTLTNNTANSNSHGITIVSSFNTLTNNTANLNDYGISITGGLCRDRNGVWVSCKSFYNTLTSNIANSNYYYGIWITASSFNNTLTNNTANSNSYGIYLDFSNVNSSLNNILTSNTTSLNYIGIFLEHSNSNTLTGNTIGPSRFSNGYGIKLNSSSNSKVYNNNLLDNNTQIQSNDGANNIYNLPAPVGGNYLSNYDTSQEGCADADSDNFCDAPYIFSGGQDNLPWTKQDGWLAPSNNSPTLSYSQDLGYIDGGINPDGGYADTNFAFKIVYTDADNDPPTDIRTIVFDGSSSDAPAIEISSDAMMLDSSASSELRDGDYANGEQYALAKSFPAGTYRYRFQASDGEIGIILDGIAGGKEQRFEVLENQLPVEHSYKVKVEGSEYQVIYELPGDLTRPSPFVGTRIFIDASGDAVTDPILAKKIAMTAYIYEKITNPQFAINIEQGAAGASNMLRDFLAVTIIEELEECIPSAAVTVVTRISAPVLNCVSKKLKDAAVLDSFDGINLVRIIAMALTYDLKDHYIRLEDETDPFINRGAIIDYDNATTTFNLLYKGTFLIEPFSTDLLFKLGKMDSGPWDQFFQIIYNSALGLYDVLSVAPSTQEAALVSAFAPAVHANWDYASALNYLATDNRLPQYVGVFGKLTDVLGSVGSLTEAADDFSFRYQFITALQQAIDNWGVKIANENQSYIEAAKQSPGELRVFDAGGHITGLIHGAISKEIPGTDYVNDRIWLPDVSQPYRYEVVSTGPGLYGLDFQRVDNGSITKFGVADIPMATSTIHEYQIDWPTLVAGGNGVVLRIDKNGDGVFEQTVTADKDLTADEFALQTETVVDFNPDTMNMKSNGKYATAYIELPGNFNPHDIAVASVKLNHAVDAESKPVSVGDYDADGIADLMVKFSLDKIKPLLSRGSNAISISGYVRDITGPIFFQGADHVRVIEQ